MHSAIVNLFLLVTAASASCGVPYNLYRLPVNEMLHFCSATDNSVVIADCLLNMIGPDACRVCIARALSDLKEKPAQCKTTCGRLERSGCNACLGEIKEALIDKCTYQARAE